MQTITKYIIITLLSFYVTNAVAQDSIPKSKASSIESLKESIKSEERDALKIEVEKINKRILDKEITYEEAENLKEAAAKRRALNIENKITIIENRVALSERNKIDFSETQDNRVTVSIGSNGFSVKSTEKKIKYDTRTTNDLFFAVGFNNAIIDGGSLKSSPYDIAQSGFMEIGWNWKTRLGESGNSPRIKYGIALQTNRYELEDNKIFVQDGNTTTLETFSEDLKLSELRITNLVVPLYFEFGKMRKVEKPNRVRYMNDGKFKFGLGGYAGIRTGTMQKLKYKQDGDRVKEKIKRNYNTNPLVYGVGAYVGIGDYSLYAKYDLSETFKNDALKQNNISLGIRMDFD